MSDSQLAFPRLTVLMVNWRTPEMTVQSVESVLKSDYPNFHICLTDNASGDSSYSYLQERLGSNVQLYQTDRNLGYAGGMNFCMSQAIKSNPEYFLIMNNDTIIDPAAISSLVKCARRYSNKCIVTGKVFFYDKKDLLQTVGCTLDRKSMSEKRIGFGEIDIGQYDHEAERELIDDIFVLLPTSIYKEIGGYSSYFFMNYEQTDFFIRIREKGYKLVYNPEAKLWHKGSFSSGGLGNPFMMYWEGKSILIVHYMHQDITAFLIFYLQYLFNCCWRIGKEILKAVLGKNHILMPRFALLRGFLAGTKWIFHQKPETGYNPYYKL